MAHWPVVRARSYLSLTNFASAGLWQLAERLVIAPALLQILPRREPQSGRLLFRRDGRREFCRGRNIRPSLHRREAGPPLLRIRRRLVSSVPPVFSLSTFSVRLTPARSPACGQTLAASRSSSGTHAFLFRARPGPAADCSDLHAINKPAGCAMVLVRVAVPAIAECANALSFRRPPAARRRSAENTSSLRANTFRTGNRSRLWRVVPGWRTAARSWARFLALRRCRNAVPNWRVRNSKASQTANRRRGLRPARSLDSKVGSR